MFFGLDASTNHVNIVVTDRVRDFARLTQPRQLIDLPFEALAEEVVDHRVVNSRALCKHARQQADFRWDGAAVTENGPQAYQTVGCPTAYKAYTDQNSNLK